MQIGFHASHEQWPPSRLLDQVRRAQHAGFQGAMCSDHFHPWLEHRGQSGFAWSWLGSALQSTTLSFGTVCAPGQRYHPAIVAQAAATLAEMYPDRLWLALGSGEALNEHITGDGWPTKHERNTRLQECVAIIRALWRGETVQHHGLVHVNDARLYTLPATPPPLFGAAISKETAAWVGTWADGLITVAKEAAELRETIDAFRQGGGDRKPVFVQAAICFADSEQSARIDAHQAWRQCVLSRQQLSDFTTPAQFEAATRTATVDDVCERLRVSADIGQHIEWLEQDRTAGADRVYLHQIGQNVYRFIDIFSEDVLPVVGSSHD